MTPVEWWLNLGTTAGIAILAVPVWSLNDRKRKLQEIRDALPEQPASFKDKVQHILAEKRGRDVADWRRIDDLCLKIGYALLLGSSVLRLLILG